MSRTLASSIALCLSSAVFAATNPGAEHSGPVAQGTSGERPTVVLVHGAFADSSSWNGVISRLLKKGYPVVAVANPLRGVKTDADTVSSVLQSLEGPVVLVGHSYGGNVITNAAVGHPNVRALVFVSAFAPDVGESAGELSARFPGGTLAAALLPPVVEPNGVRDLFIQRDKFRAQFAADVPEPAATLMAVTQRPIAESALGEPSASASWRAIPSWFVYGSKDKNIPPAAIAFMAQRAGARKTVEIKGGSHVVMTSHPDEIALLVEEAASAK